MITVPSFFNTGLVLVTLFDPTKGLLAFLTTMIDQPSLRKDLESTIIQTLHLITSILSEFSDVYQPYIKTTQVQTKQNVQRQSSHFKFLCQQFFFLGCLRTCAYYRSSVLSEICGTHIV